MSGFKKGDKSITNEEAAAKAERIGMSIEEWAANYGWESDLIDDFQTGVVGTDAPATPVATPSRASIIAEPQESTELDLDPGLLELQQRADGFKLPNADGLLKTYQSGEGYNPRTGATRSKEVILSEGTRNERKGIDWEDPTPEEVTAWRLYNYGQAKTKSNKRGREIENPLYVAEKDINFFVNETIKQEDLDIAYDNYAYNKNRSTNFIDKYLPNLPESINKIDFQGYLARNGYDEAIKDYEQQGMLDQETLIYSDLEQNALEEDKLNTMLSEYNEHVNRRNRKKSALQHAKANPSLYEGANTIDEIQAIAFDTDQYNPNKQGKDAYVKLPNKDFIYESYDWADENFKNLSAYNESVRKKLFIDYEQDKDRNIVRKGSDVPFNVVISAIEGFGQESVDFGLWVTDLIGFDTWSENQSALRSLRRRNEISTMDYRYAKGLEAVYTDGRNYILGENGEIWDTKAEKEISRILEPKDYQKLSDFLQENGEEDYHISARGSSKIFGTTIGSLGFQVAGPKGVGLARTAVVAARAKASLNILAKAGKLGRFKSATKYANYAKRAQAGKNKGAYLVKNAENFGINMPKVKASAEVINATMFQGLYGASHGYNNTMRAALDANMSTEDADDLARIASSEMAALYTLTGPLAPKIPQQKLLGRLFDPKNNVYKRLTTAYNTAKKGKANPYTAVKNEFSRAVQSVFNKKTGGLFAAEGIKEVVQENVQQLGETFLVNPDINLRAGKDILETEYTLEQFVETSILSLAVGGLSGGISGVSYKYNPNKLMDLMTVSSDVEGASKRLDYLVNENQITRRQANQILKDADAVKFSFGNKKVPEYMIELNPDTYVKMARNSLKINELETEKNQLDKGLQGDLQTKIDKLNQAQEKLAKGENITEIYKDTKFLKKVAGNDGVVVLKNRAEAIAKNYKGKDLFSNGFMEEDGKIVIMLDVAAENSQIAVASHELLHKILKAEFTNDGKPTELQTRILKEFKGILKKNGLLKDIEKRLKLNYTDINTVHMDEFFTAFSDIVGTKLKLGQDVSKLGESFWESVGRFISRLLRGRLGTKQTFDSGQEVFNFIINYQKNFQKGKLSKLAQAKIKAGEGVKGTKSSSITAPEKFTAEQKDGMFQEGNKAFNDAADAYGLNLKINSDGTPNFTKEQWDAVDDNTKLGIGVMIGDQYASYVAYRMKSRDQVPGYDQLKDEIINRTATGTIKGDDGIPFLVKTYNPEGGAKLSTYIFGRIDNRLQGVINKTEGFGEITTEAAPSEPGKKQLVGDESAEQEITKKIRKGKEKKKVFKKASDEIVIIGDDNKISTIDETFSTSFAEKVKKLWATGKYNIADFGFRQALLKDGRIMFVNQIRDMMDRASNWNNTAKVGNKDKRANYDSFVDANFQSIYNLMTVDQVSARFPFLLETALDENGNEKSMSVEEVNAYNDAIDRGESQAKKIKNIYANNKLRIKKPYSAEVKKQGTEYLKANDRPTNVRNARKVSLAEIVADQMLKDELPEVLRAEGLENEAAIQEVETQIGRRKYSISSLSPTEFNKFELNRAEFFNQLRTLMGGKYTEASITRAVKNVYPDFSKEQHKSIGKQFFKLLKPLSPDFESELKAEGKTFEDYLNDIAADIDGQSTITAMTNAYDSVSNMFTDWNNVERSRIVVESALETMDIQTAVAFTSASFANSGRVGRWVDGVLIPSKTHRSDLYAGQAQVIEALNRAGFNIKSISPTEIELNTGKVLKRKYSATGNVLKGHLTGKFDSKADKANAEAAWNYTTTILQSIKGADAAVQAVVMASLNSGTNTALRAAAPVTYRSSVLPTMNPKKYRYEHGVPARVVLAHMYEVIVNGNKDIDLDALKSDYQVAIIPVEMDKVIGKSGYQQVMIAGYKPGETPWWKRYYNFATRGKIQYALESLEDGSIIGQQYADYFNQKGPKPEVKANAEAEVKKITTQQKALNNAKKRSYTKNPKGISVYDFDDTLAFSKSNVLYTMPGEVKIYHGGDIKSVKDIDGFVYFSEDQKQAAAYAKGNQGEVSGFKIDETSIATEDQVFDVINALGIKPRAGYAVDESNLYELIDPRFEQSFSKKDLDKLTVALKGKGIKAARFTDTNISQGKNEGRETENIVVFDKKTVQEQNKLTPAEFAKQGDQLAKSGAEFDFSEFNKVVEGRPGPLAPRLKKAIEKFGNKNIFVLTARPAESANAIHAFLKGIGLEIPLENITGLANGAPAAKAAWMVGKVADGFNDFYFVDDHMGNVKAVKDVLNVFDVKGKVQQARIKRSNGLGQDLNKMIERNKGVKSEAIYSKIRARKEGARKGKFKFFVPYGAEDFRGLTSYTLAGKGKQGEADQKFFEDNLVVPYMRGISAMEKARRALKNDFTLLLKMFPGMKKRLGKQISDTDYTVDQAVRVYLWTQQEQEVPGISKRDQKKLSNLVANDPDLSAFADGLQKISKQDQWPTPSEYWIAGSVLKDINEINEVGTRAEYLQEFNDNVDIIFDENNLTKLEAIYGTRYVNALKNSIARMKSGRNRPAQPGAYEQKWLNWVNNSVGTIMFFNRRSAAMQMLSFANFVNWSDNNPLKAGLAFANQPAYWSAWSKIFNSDKLKERRGGLKSDVQEQEIANQAKNSKDKASAVIAYLLKIGFTPTQIADSFAIATGGATFLINRTKTYKKQGLSQAEAEAKAFEDFSAISDETQQSGDPMLVSAQQSSHLGRLILAFQNTPMQYTRLMKKAGQDLINGRGDAKTNLSKIAYYGFVQNLIFSALQNSLFALLPGFDDEEEDDEQYEKIINTKTERIVNSMVDTVLRGSGLTGAVVSTLKNVINRYYKEEKKGYNADHAYTLLELANVSPPIGSKMRKVYGAIQTKKFDKDVMEAQGWDVTLDGRFNISPNYEILASLSSAGLNLPLDRALAEIDGIAEALDTRNTSYQRLALGLGWRTWDVNAEKEEEEFVKTEGKARRKQEGKEKAKKTRAENRKKKLDDYAAMTPKERAEYDAELKAKRKESARKATATRKETKRVKDSIDIAQGRKIRF